MLNPEERERLLEMFKTDERRVVRNTTLCNHFEYAGLIHASYGNMDVEEAYVVDPLTLECLRDVKGNPVKAKLDQEYPMIRHGINNTSCKFYPNAVLTQSMDEKLRETGEMEGHRDWYDATMLVRVQSRPAQIFNFASAEGLPAWRKFKPESTEHSAKIYAFPGVVLPENL